VVGGGVRYYLDGTTIGVVRYSPGGAQISARLARNPDPSGQELIWASIRDLKVDAFDRIHVTGNYRDSAAPQWTRYFYDYILPGAGGFEELPTYRSFPEFPVSGTAITAAIAPNGYTYVVGDVEGALTINQKTSPYGFSDNYPPMAVCGHDGTLIVPVDKTVNYSPSGDVLWVAPGGTDAAVDSAGFIYVTGSYGGTMRTAKYSPDGQQVWQVLWSHEHYAYTYGEALALDGSGNVYVTGNCIDGSSVVRTYAVKFGSSSRLTASPTNLHAGGLVTVSWEAEPRYKDWIGLYKVGAPDNEYRYLWWRYTGDKPTGSFTIDSPGKAGEYEFRYFSDNALKKEATSNPFTVFLPEGYSVQTPLATVHAGQTITADFTAPSA
jgi:hypothetical protein